MNPPPNGLVVYTSNRSQSCVESDELLTDEDIMACETENFVEYIDELAEKAILLKHVEDPNRGVIVKPSDSSRYFEGGKRKAKRNIRTRFGIHYKAPGTFCTTTYDHEKYSRWEAWRRLAKDLKRFKHDITMIYKRQGHHSPRYILVIEDQSKTGNPNVP